MSSFTFKTAPYTKCTSCKYYSIGSYGSSISGICTYNGSCYDGYIHAEGHYLPDELIINGVTYIKKEKNDDGIKAKEEE